MTKVIIGILNWNGLDDTKECLSSLRKINKEGLNIELVVVDNASTDNSVNELKKEKVTLLLNKVNKGYAGGNNTALSYAISKKADYVCVLNNDTVVDKNFLINLVNSAEEKKDGGAFSPLIYFAKGYEFHKEKYSFSMKGKVIWYGGGKIDWKNVLASNAHVDEVDKGKLIETETDFTTGACVLFRIDAIRKVGTFGEKYFLYLEDVDISVRMKRMGWKSYFVPKSKIWHKVSQSSGIGSGLNDYFIARNRMLFGLRYAGIRAKLALIKESIKLLVKGRKWQRIGIIDFYLRRLGKGSWK